MNIEQALAQIEALPGVTQARLWDGIPGQQRIFIKTIKSNGGKSWNGGVGYARCFITIANRELVMEGEAGATTRKQHEALGTREALQRIAMKINSGNDR